MTFTVTFIVNWLFLVADCLLVFLVAVIWYDLLQSLGPRIRKRAAMAFQAGAKKMGLPVKKE
jgi:hypothetical protein